jgi:sodium/bile acid cotransporter 7
MDPTQFLMSCIKLVKANWFLLGLVVVILLAYAWPLAGSKRGPLRTEYLVGYGVTAVVFLVSGLSLDTQVLSKALIHWKLILSALFVSFGVAPAICYAFSSLFTSLLSIGIVVMGSMPTTIASNVLMTRQSMGNEAGALIIAVMGNLTGVFVSPLLIYGFLNQAAQINFGSIFLKLGLSVILPLFVGQILRYAFTDLVKKTTQIVNFGYINSCLLLILVWSVFCDSFLEGVFTTVPPLQTGLTFLLCLGLFILFSILSFGLGLLIRLQLYDTIALVMCGSTKTVALGIPLIQVIFKENAGVIAVPLLMYHSLQLVVGSILVIFFKNRMIKAQVSNVE